MIIKTRPHRQNWGTATTAITGKTDLAFKNTIFSNNYFQLLTGNGNTLLPMVNG